MGEVCEAPETYLLYMCITSCFTKLIPKFLLSDNCSELQVSSRRRMVDGLYKKPKFARRKLLEKLI